MSPILPQIKHLPYPAPAALILLLSRRQRSPLVWIALAAFPLMVYWATIDGNSDYRFEIIASPYLVFVDKGDDRIFMRDGSRRKTFYFPGSKRKKFLKRAKRKGYHVVRI